MERIFLSYHYDEAGRRLADVVQDLVSSHGLLVLTGERLGGRPLSEEVKTRIRKCDGLIALFTERPEERDDAWVRDERAYADGQKLRILSVIEKGSSDNGMYAGNEQVFYDPDDPLPAFLRLSGTIGDWRREGGRFVNALLIPPDIGARAHKDHAKVEYRLWQQDETSDWREAKCQKTGHRETVAFLKSVPEASRVEVRLSHNGQVWESGARDQLLSIRLEES